MTDLKTDEEKAEEIKQWWRENGTSVIVGVVLAIAGVFGWQQWKQHKLTTAEEASALYAEEKAGMDDLALASLKGDYGSTPYAALAALTAARQAVEKKDEAKAIQELQWVVDNASETTIQEIAKIRLARLYIATNNLDGAQTILQQKFATAYTSLIEELKGDLYVAQKNFKQAAQAYDRAILATGGRAPQYLQMKRDNLGNSNEQS